MKDQNDKTFSERITPGAVILLFFVIIWALSMTPAKAQSFFAHKYHKSFAGIGQTIKTQTFGQKIRTKVQYNRKRHNNEGFAFREMRRRSRAKQI